MAYQARYDDEDEDRTNRWRGAPCVIYVRISQADIRAVLRALRAATEQDREAALAEKVQMHLAEARAYAEEVGLEVIEEFVERYVSASRFRGAKTLPERERLMAWLADRTGTMVVLTTEVERLYRDIDEAKAMVAEADRLNDLAEGRGRRLAHRGHRRAGL